MVRSEPPSTADIIQASYDSGSHDCCGHSSLTLANGGFEPMHVFPGRAYPGNDVPRSVRSVATVPHGQRFVCSVAIDKKNGRIVTGGKGSVKVWDMARVLRNPACDYMEPLHEIHYWKIGSGKAYILACKPLSTNNDVVVFGGDMSEIVFCNLEVGSRTRFMRNIERGTVVCWSLAVWPDSALCLAAGSSGVVNVFDTRTHDAVAGFMGHDGGTSCVDVSPDGRCIWTGGYNGTLSKWDIRRIVEGEPLSTNDHQFPDKIFTLACCPTDDYVSVGMDNKLVDVLHTERSAEHYRHALHESRILSTKFAQSGKWFVSTGMDGLMAGWRTPHGGSIFQYYTRFPINSCDISADDKYIVTGSTRSGATIYEVLY